LVGSYNNFVVYGPFHSETEFSPYNVSGFPADKFKLQYSIGNPPISLNSEITESNNSYSCSD
jgi:hypothetical protein